MLPISAISASKVKVVNNRPIINDNYQQYIIIDNTNESKTLSEEDKQEIISIFNLSIIFNNRLFRIIILISLLVIGIYININHQQYAIIPSDDYRVEYNKNLNEYYLYTNDDYIDLKLYLNKDVDQITISAYTMDGTNIYNNSYSINDQIMLNKDTNIYYQIIENDQNFNVYIINE